MTGPPRYAFEERILAFAEELSRRFVGGRRAFFVGLRDDGSPRRIYFAEDGPFDAAQKDRLAGAHPRWFLFLPHDEGTYLEWLDVDRATFERWLGAPLGPDALVDRTSTGSRGAFPTSWRVIVR